MSQDKCPRCGGIFVGTAKDFVGTKICHDCRHTWVPGRPDLTPIDWKARAEDAGADLAQWKDSYSAAMLLRENEGAELFKTKAELAKRERALEEAEAYHIEYIHQQIGGSTVEESVAFASAKAPNYAEWLKNREEKK